MAETIYNLSPFRGRKNKARDDHKFYEIIDADTLEVLGAFGNDYEAQSFEREATIERLERICAAALQSEREAERAEARRALLEEIEAHCSDPGSWPSAIYQEVAEEVLDAVRALASPPAPQEETECARHGHVWIGTPADGYPDSFKCARPGCGATAPQEETR